MKTGNWIAILDFGSQYTQLIARRIREQKVYSEILRFDTQAAKLRRQPPAGIILSGGPASVLQPGAPRCDPALFQMGLPVLGICYGMQLTAHLLGGAVQPGAGGEYGPAAASILRPGALFNRLPRRMRVWMSHGDQVVQLPPGFDTLAGTAACRQAAMADLRRKIYGIQFHPEVVHTPRGEDILRNFLFAICRCRPDWAMARFVQETIRGIRRRVGGGQVVCGLSGGVDSAVTALLVHRAIGPRLHCIFVDNGLLRHGEALQVEETFGRQFGLNLRVIDARREFLRDLRGVDDPERKRKLIGRRFIQVFRAAARRLGEVKFLAQGTLYPDVIESFSPVGGPSATIKSHHNVGGLPANLKFELIEPLRELFKDEVRQAGRALGLPEAILARQPFPGPGLAVRIVGTVTAERVELLQQADLRIQQEFEKYSRRAEIWQAFGVLLPVKSVGVMGDGRTYANALVLRAVTSRDGMTADWARLPPHLLARISNRIINEVPGINRVVYDISSKPPATIEWE